MKLRVAILVALVAAYVGALHLTGVAQGGAAAQGQGSRPRDWTQDMAMKITEPFTLASVVDLFGTTYKAALGSAS